MQIKEDLKVNDFKVRYQKINWNKYFKLTSLRVSFLALILALNIVLAVFSKFVLGLIQIPPVTFLVLELTLITYFILLYVINLFYTIVFIFLATWMRFFIGDEPIGMLAMNLIDIVSVLTFWIVNFLVYKLVIGYIKTQKQHLITLYISQGTAGLFAAFAAAGFGVLINWAFLLKLYGVPEESRDYLLIPILIFNFVKIVINLIIYLSIFYAIDLLFKRYDI
ncbi:hypothetical protein [Spiroplasma alleghenense]|uniref:ECF transporter S component n=1 Tax=Spiroplasma alleghenense TaxID=216931 RepID=A0A345Z495_9MOLU|nr:hypothetical protein [Spiroplasma alleghenense]AXK51424.1 hypothetical protein SALLE_v1c07540 [Spiroplasma alleghenense]